MAEDSATITGAENAEVDANRKLILDARKRGPGALFKAFVRLSGPGWLQSAITLGGGSLSSSLFLGVLAGTALLWLQPFAMIIGVIMLSAISYVVLSTGERPFRAINRHVSPVLGWGWILATMMANLVWSLPQFSLAQASIRQNLLPGVFGGMNDTAAKIVVCVLVAVFCVVVVLLYDRGQRGAKVCDVILKLMVATIIISFFGVVIKLSLTGNLQWGRILAGLIPDLRLLSAPPRSLGQLIEQVPAQFQDYWNTKVVADQRGVMIAAAATAVGINMTFLLPYSMLRRGWDSDFRGMAIFDLATGLFVPFILVTGCVVVVAAAQFHTRPAPGGLGQFDANGIPVRPNPKIVAMLKGRLQAEIGVQQMAATVAIADAGEKAQAVLDSLQGDGPPELTSEQIATYQAAAGRKGVLMDRLMLLPEADKRLAATLVKRSAFQLADSLEPLTGKVFAQYIFGIGVVGMAVSSIIILMLINGFVVCEIMDRPATGRPYITGCMLPLVGILGPFVWTGGKAQFWLAVPTSNIAFVFLPIAYLSFAFLLNQKSLLGDAMPTGRARFIWNLLVFPSAALAAVGSVWKLWSGLRWLGIGILAIVVVLCAVVHVKRSGGTARAAGEAGGAKT